MDARRDRIGNAASGQLRARATPRPPAVPHQSRLRHAGRWVLLVLASALGILALELLRLPAALLLGAMVAAIGFAAAGQRVGVPGSAFSLAQAVVGTLMARSIPASIVPELMRDWPIFTAAVVLVIGAAAGLGWLLARLQVLPGSTAVWGSSPGAATAMVLMSESFGADVRLVAFMQYLRVVFVALAATVVARFWAASATESAFAHTWFPPLGWPAFPETVVLIVLSSVFGRVLRLPAGPMLLPLVVGTVLNDTGLITIELPQWLLALAYLVVGWSIGMRFTREILIHAARAFPRVAAAILSLMALCACFAGLLVAFAHVDPLTAYLATSPGGADTVAIISASTPVNVPFVMALQTARFVIVLLTGPALARLVARAVGMATPRRPARENASAGLTADTEADV